MAEAKAMSPIKEKTRGQLWQYMDLFNFGGHLTGSVRTCDS